MIDWSVAALRAVDSIGAIVVAMPEGASVEAPAGTIGVPGGATRSQSVRCALAAAGDEGGVVVVHDAARPLLEPELVERCIAALGEHDAAIAAAPVADTIKETGGDGVVVRTLDRSVLWAVQTPQVFRRAALARALEQPDDVLAAATDDAGLVESLGGSVVVVPAPAENLKVTTAVDRELAELLLRARAH